MPWTIFNRYGQRKYLTKNEVDSFIRSSQKYPTEVRAFCSMLAYTGCRISEALALTRENIDFETGHVIIRSLKKRGKRLFRTIPLPATFLKLLYRWLKTHRNGGEPLWPWCRMTGYRRICEVMNAAGIYGSYASPKGLRHAFGVRAIQASVPLTLVQRWLGHADIKTTAIYTDAMGPEEREIAARMWKAQSVWSAPAYPASLDDEQPFEDEAEAPQDRLSSGGEHEVPMKPPLGLPGDHQPIYQGCRGLSKIIMGTKMMAKFGVSRLTACAMLQNWI